jgi:chemotaxis protein CheD
MEPAASFPKPPPLMVGLGEFTVSREPGAALCTGPLGAGLAVSIYDFEAVAGGVLHAFLPGSRLDRFRSEERPGIFVDTGLSAMLQALEKLGAVRGRCLVAVAGAGQIIDGGSDFDLGGQNRAALESALAAHGLKIRAAEIEGHANRALRLNIGNGEASVRTIPDEKEVILCRP